GEQRAVELLVDERVEHVRAGVQLRLRRAELRIDRHAYDTARLDGAAEQVPRATVHGLEAGHARFAAGPRDDTAIGELPPAAGMERALLEHDGAGPRVDDRGLQREHVGMVVAKV